MKKGPNRNLSFRGSAALRFLEKPFRAEDRRWPTLSPDFVNHALRMLESAGAKLVDVSLPHTDYGLAAYYIIAPAECSSNLARFDGVKYGMSDQEAQNITDAYMQT